MQQKADGSLVFTRYGVAGNPGDSWSVAARQQPSSALKKVAERSKAE